MKDRNGHTKELLTKFMSDQYTEEELLDLFEKTNTEEFDRTLTEMLPDSLDEIETKSFTKSEIRQYYRELTDKLGLPSRIRSLFITKVIKYAPG
ncbi:MAG: hypothetical protein LUD02_02915 [Tannerellaceae bacterium]|nr:hypothetical protein [Tannerellaceae bacterium]